MQRLPVPREGGPESEQGSRRPGHVFAPCPKQVSLFGWNARGKRQELRESGAQTVAQQVWSRTCRARAHPSALDSDIYRRWLINAQARREQGIAALFRPKMGKRRTWTRCSVSEDWIRGGGPEPDNFPWRLWSSPNEFTE